MARVLTLKAWRRYRDGGLRDDQGVLRGREEEGGDDAQERAHHDHPRRRRAGHLPFFFIPLTRDTKVYEPYMRSRSSQTCNKLLQVLCYSSLDLSITKVYEP